MDRKELREMVKRLEKDTKHFSDIEVEETDTGDDVIFDFTRFSQDDMETVTKRLKVHRFPSVFPDGSPIPVMGGKVIVTELVKCPTCEAETWKNVSKEIGTIMQGVDVRGWSGA